MFVVSKGKRVTRSHDKCASNTRDRLVRGVERLAKRWWIFAVGWKVGFGLGLTLLMYTMNAILVKRTRRGHSGITLRKDIRDSILFPRRSGGVNAKGCDR